MTVVSRSEDHTRKNGAIEPNEDPLMTTEFDWVERLFVPVFVFDGDLHQVIAWNAKMEDITGLLADQIVTQSIGSMLKEESMQILASAVAVVVGGSDSAVCNISLSDSGKHLTLNMSAHRRSHGKSTQIVCFAEKSKSVDTDPTEPSVDSIFPMVSIDAQCQVTGWNAPLESLTGFCTKDTVGRSLLAFIPQREHQERIRRTISLAAASVHGRSCCVDFMLGDGGRKRMVINASPGQCPNLEGGTYHLIFSDASDLGEHDVLEPAPSKAALHHADTPPPSDETQDLKQLFDNAGAAIFGIDTIGRVKDWNQKTAEITGFSADEALNQDLVETFIAPDFQPAVRELVRNALRGRGTTNFELEIQKKDGEIRYLLVNANPRRDLKNQIVGVVAFAQDITESCKHDRAVASMANELRKLIDTANAPIFGIDKDG